MRTVLATLILAAAVLISVTAFGLFSATIGEPLGSPLASAAYGGETPAS
ncbi:hypothetical protein [Methylocella sp.]